MISLENGPLSASALEQLEDAKQCCHDFFLGFWFQVGTSLTIDELKNLRWENFYKDKGRWTIRIPIGPFETVETIVAARPSSEIIKLKLEHGPVFCRSQWVEGVRFFKSLQSSDGNPLNLDECRAFFRAPKARRIYWKPRNASLRRLLSRGVEK